MRVAGLSIGETRERREGMKWLGIILALFLLVAVAGCTSTQKGATIGGLAGAGIGAGIGSLSSHAGAGALIGGVGGAVAGALIGNAMED